MKKELLLLLFVANLMGIQAIQSNTMAGLICPSDTTVGCDAEIHDLSGYGDAYLKTYTDTIDAGQPTVQYHLNDCNVGFITRTWSIHDPYGHYHTCTQTITVESDGSFSEHNIHWPPDYMTDECGASLEPEDLPEPFNAPKWDDVSCAMIMYNHKDLDFYISDGCVKILRKWTLIDWCTYDPNSHYPSGRWEHTQVLKITSLDGPEIDCIQDVTVSSGSACHTAYVQLGDVTGSTICGGGVTVTNNSPYADEAGPNASGHYPLGTTIVKFTAADGCGNKSTCKVKITVKDLKQPTPVCLHGLSSTLSVMSNGYYTVLYPELFDKGSFDNCTDRKDLKFWVEPDTLWCEDLDTAEVRVYVQDEAGNVSYCDTYVYLTDNQSKCPNTGTFTYSGTLKGPETEYLTSGTMYLTSGSNLIAGDIDSDGSFVFKDLNVRDSYSLDFRGANIYDEQSTMDQVYLIQSLLGNDVLSDHVALAALDMDGDQLISTFDAYLMQQSLLGKVDSSAGSANDKLFVDLSIPFETGFNVPNDLIKNEIGGANRNDNISDSLLYLRKGCIKEFGANKGEDDTPFHLIYEGRETLEQGIEYEVSLNASENISFLGLQLSLKLTPNSTNELRVLVGNKELSQDAYDFNSVNGKLKISEAFLSTVQINANEAFLKLFIVPAKTISGYEFISIDTESKLKPEVYGSDLSIKRVLLDRPVSSVYAYSNENSRPIIKLYPNPLNRQANLNLQLEMPDGIVYSSHSFEYDVIVLNSSGQVVVSERVNFESQESISSFGKRISALYPGMYTVQFVNAKYQFAERLIIQ